MKSLSQIPNTIAIDKQSRRILIRNFLREGKSREQIITELNSLEDSVIQSSMSNINPKLDFIDQLKSAKIPLVALLVKQHGYTQGEAEDIYDLVLAKEKLRRGEIDDDGCSTDEVQKYALLATNTHRQIMVPGVGVDAPIFDSDNQEYFFRDNSAANSFRTAGMHIESLGGVISRDAANRKYLDVSA